MDLSAPLRNFRIFAKTDGFKLITRSPYYARATGNAEAAVKEAKKMLKKLDLSTGLLFHRSTPSGSDLLPGTKVSLPTNKV